MDALTAIRTRRSVRKFSRKPIPKDILEQMVDAGRLAPTARNEQPWEFVVLTDPARIAELAGMTDHGRFMQDAAAAIAVLSKDTKYYLEDGCAATENILLAATALGVQSCWIAGDKKAYADNILRHLGAPADFKLVSLLALGYADGEVKSYPKRDLARLLHWERF